MTERQNENMHGFVKKIAIYMFEGMIKDKCFFFVTKIGLKNL